jgi:hypothetical protein
MCRAVGPLFEMMMLTNLWSCVTFSESRGMSGSPTRFFVDFISPGKGGGQEGDEGNRSAQKNCEKLPEGFGPWNVQPQMIISRQSPI